MELIVPLIDIRPNIVEIKLSQVNRVDVQFLIKCISNRVLVLIDSISSLCDLRMEDLIYRFLIQILHLYTTNKKY